MIEPKELKLRTPMKYHSAKQRQIMSCAEELSPLLHSERDKTFLIANLLNVPYTSYVGQRKRMLEDLNNWLTDYS